MGDAIIVVDNDDMVIVQRPVGPFQMNQYLLGCKRTREAALIDSGEDPKNFFASCAEKGGFVIKHLIQTHAHIDHVAGLCPTKRLYSDAPIYMHKSDLPVYNSTIQKAAMYGFNLETPLPRIDVFVSDNDSVVVGKIKLNVLFTPGHCPGHCVYFHDHPTDPVAFVGDLIFRGSVGRTDLPLCNPSDMQKSVVRVVNELAGNVTLLPGHMETTTVAEERASNPFVLSWLAASQVSGGR
jgi:hydroxyacylglutathione hydrolase